jgi:hypothetical protein
MPGGVDITRKKSNRKVAEVKKYEVKYFNSPSACPVS